MDAPHAYVRALALGCFYSHISTRTFRRALTASVDSSAEIECTFSDVTKSGRVWRKVPESDAGSVGWSLRKSFSYFVVVNFNFNFFILLFSFFSFLGGGGGVWRGGGGRV